VDLLAEPEVSGAEEGLVEAVLGIAARVGEKIPGDVFARETIKSDVVVEGADHVVPILPGAENRVVELVAHGFGVAGFVEPVARPSFTEVRGGQEAIDHSLEGGVGIVVCEIGELGCRGGESGEEESGAADEGALVGLRGGREPGGFEPCEDEVVDSVEGPGGIVDGRGADGLDGLPSPMRGASGWQVEDLAWLGCWGGGAGGVRPDGAGVDPFGDVVHNLGAEPGFGWHLQVGVFVADGLEQEAIVGIFGIDCGTGIASLEEAGATVDAQPGAEAWGLGGVTGVAVFDEDGADVTLEVFQGGVQGCGEDGAGEGGQEDLGEPDHGRDRTLGKAGRKGWV